MLHGDCESLGGRKNRLRHMIHIQLFHMENEFGSLASSEREPVGLLGRRPPRASSPRSRSRRRADSGATLSSTSKGDGWMSLLRA